MTNLKYGVALAVIGAVVGTTAVQAAPIAVAPVSAVALSGAQGGTSVDQVAYRRYYGGGYGYRGGYGRRGIGVGGAVAAGAALGLLGAGVAAAAAPAYGYGYGYGYPAYGYPAYGYGGYGYPAYGYGW